MKQWIVLLLHKILDKSYIAKTGSFGKDSMLYDVYREEVPNRPWPPIYKGRFYYQYKRFCYINNRLTLTLLKEKK